MNNSMAFEITLLKWQENRQKARQALLELLEEQEFETISTEMIIEKSQLPRWIFYQCCNGKYDLTKSWMKEILQYYAQLIKECFEHKNVAYFIRELATKIENSDNQNIDVFVEKLSPKQEDLDDNFLTLWKINTPQINLYIDMKNILKQEFVNSSRKHINATTDWECKATVFAELSLSLQKQYLMIK